jgi:F-type H+-transporting ATPase subunit epsilon
VPESALYMIGSVDEEPRMNLRVYVPSQVFEVVEVDEVIAESGPGQLRLLPRHIDFVATALVPGILTYITLEGDERFLAVDEGVLVKQGDEVFVSVRAAAKGELGELREAVERMVTDVDEKERSAQTAVARLEASFVSRFLELGKRG